MSASTKCGHCRRARQKVFTVKAKDGSALKACACGKTWIRAAPTPQPHGPPP